MNDSPISNDTLEVVPNQGTAKDIRNQHQVDWLLRTAVPFVNALDTIDSRGLPMENRLAAVDVFKRTVRKARTKLPFNWTLAKATTKQWLNTDAIQLIHWAKELEKNLEPVPGQEVEQSKAA